METQETQHQSDLRMILSALFLDLQFARNNPRKNEKLADSYAHLAVWCHVRGCKAITLDDRSDWFRSAQKARQIAHMLRFGQKWEATRNGN